MLEGWLRRWLLARRYQALRCGRSFLNRLLAHPAVGILLVDILHDFAVITKAPSLLAIEL
jgi:hypothetical protein